MRRSVRMRRGLGPGALAMLLVFALAAMAIGYALWFQVLTINSIVQTGNVHAAFTNAFTDDDDVPDDPARDAGDNDDCADLGGVDIDGDGLTSCDPAASEDGIPDNLPGGPGPEPRHDKDVARCDASVDAADSSVGHIRKRNVYPGYFCTAWFEIHNDGSIPVKLARVLVNGKLVTPSQPTPFDLNGDGTPDIEVHITGLQTCVQIEPGEKVLMDVDQQILQGVPQGVLLQYSVRVLFAQWNEQCPPTPAVFDVTATGVSPSAAAGLASALNLPSDPLAPDGSLLFVDPARFQAVPMMPAEPAGLDEDGQETTSEAINFDALRQLTVPSDEEVLSRFGEALEKSQLLPASDFGTPAVGHSMFDLVLEGQTTQFPLDSQVNFSFLLQGVPVVGPGQKIKASFDGEGMVSQLIYASRQLSEGDSVPIISTEEAQRRCLALFEQQAGTRQASFFDVFADLVYYAPPLEMQVQRIYPHFQCGGTTMVGGEEIILENILIPAVTEGGPAVELSMDVDGSFVSAQAAVSGGTAPFSFLWSSSNVTFDPAQATAGPSIEYNVVSREPADVVDETLCVTATDANALTTTDCQTVQVTPQPLIEVPHESIEVGSEWLAACAGLPDGAQEAGGFVSTFQAEPGVTVDFNWGEFNAWEQDFKDPSKGGDDSNWVDEVDAVYYTGHASGNGFTFCSNVDDGLLHYSEALWGNLDHEWLGISACGPLQDSTGGLTWWQRWGPAFAGLHLLAGRKTVGYSSTVEGQIYAETLLGRGFYGFFLGAQRVRTAWALAESLTQPSSVIYSYMGVIGSGGASNYNDYFWNKGPVGPDIFSPIGYWRVSSPS